MRRSPRTVFERRLRGVNHDFGAVERSRHRLFSQDVLTRRAGEHHMLAVQVGGRANVDSSAH